MKVRFLGTSHGVPEVNRASQSMLFETENGAYLVDAGAPVIERLVNCGIELEKLKAVFITHQHYDHMAGLLNLLCLATWYFETMSFTVYFTEECDTEDFKNFLAKFEPPVDRITYKVVKKGTFFDDGNMKVTAYPTSHMEHMGKNAYGYMLESEGKKVYVTGDMHPTLKDFPTENVKGGVDMFISECAHFPERLLADKLKEIEAERIAIVHVFPKEKYPIFDKINESEFGNMIFPKDEEIFEI